MIDYILIIIVGIWGDIIYRKRNQTIGGKYGTF